MNFLRYIVETYIRVTVMVVGIVLVFFIAAFMIDLWERLKRWLS